jgi:hypothetical protein
MRLHDSTLQMEAWSLPEAALRQRELQLRRTPRRTFPEYTRQEKARLETWASPPCTAASAAPYALPPSCVITRRQRS